MRTKRLMPFAICLMVLLWVVVRWNRYYNYRDIISAKGEQLMAHADSAVLYSLDPGDGNPETPRAQVGPNSFHGYPILGSVTIHRSDELTELIGGVTCALEPGLTAECFEPRIGVRTINKSGSLDLLICFKCSKVYAYDERGIHVCGITDVPKRSIQAALTRAHVRLAPE